MPLANDRPAASFAFSPAVPVDILDRMLAGYEPDLRHYLVSGFRDGFSIGSSIPDTGVTADRNLPSCDEAPQVVDEYIAAELRAGRLAGPFPDPCPAVSVISPIGLIPKKTPGAFRIIHHLSFPSGASVNDHIPREHTAVQYGSLDEAVEKIADLSAPFLAKTDIVNAFRLIPVAERDSALLGFRWRGRIYADRAIPMGCASSSQIFQAFSDALVFIAQRHFGAGPIIAVLDDFLFVGASHLECEASLSGFLAMCQALCVPHPP